MNTKVLKTLEYEKIKQQLFDFLTTASGKSEAEQLMPSSQIDQINVWQQETAEAVMIDRLKGGIPIAQLADIDQELKRLNIGASLTAVEISAISKVLTNTAGVANFFAQMTDDPIGESVELLVQQAESLVALPELTKRIAQAIDDNAQITDDASTTLKHLRGRIIGHENSIKQKMQNHVRGKAAQYLSEPIVTMRSNRYVIPVKAEYRHQVAGVVHDQSQSGLTYYVEPQDIVELSNQLSELQVQAASEEQKILAEISQVIAEHIDEIRNNVLILGHLDFVNAKARLAKKMKALQPALSAQEHVNLQQAWHPLLDQKIAVANDIILGEDYKTLIITGPNTGGKTISIKTLGLLQLMAQSGLFITTRRPSTVGVFEEIFADIGDEQSIEQNLSTFSSHMANIKKILSQTNDRSLVILDELGAGTDPAEGAALAMAILDKIAQLGAYTIATTHYPELKVYGYDRPQTMNASMVFDVTTLRPTYQLLIGVPGQSNALAIAKRLGFTDDIIDNAKNLTDPADHDLNRMIEDLIAQRRSVKHEREALETQRLAVTKEQQDLTEKSQKLDQEQAKLILSAKKEANHIVANTKKEAERLVKEIRQERLAAGQKGGLSEQELQKKRKSLADLHQNDHLERNRILKKAKSIKQLSTGDEVVVQSYGQQGTLIKKHSNGQWEVEMGILKMLVDEDDIVKSQGTQKAQKQKKQQRVVKTTAAAPSRATVKSKLDLRGVRYEAALTELDRYLDTAVLSNLSPVEIIHGKGTGALRKGVTEFLRTDRRVQEFHFASANAGGDGATIVSLK
ncbi:endonuclease MutS2 [Convivina intestini]|uniref:Endonuclease MutS2 n=1 Tax=Convivina intestini TaxID=1505726 RepID=A0A2U1DBZ7_9LACO|nr:endonuclease MutS2 [Convivina intestini]PVY85119.1 DNA mismatch repair protein MutS2 [Convivina intestini]CAH1853833.1 Endonuclease MutS2 [Convivina intestini]SDB88364.1 DNA mismatch repair protein MutS2 [Leuconostocaceae bacterium R-53105]